MINEDYETSHEPQIPSIPSDKCELGGRLLFSMFSTITSPGARIEDTEV